MTDIRKRNLEILRMSRDGARNRDIARRFKIHPSNIGGILRRFAEKERLELKIKRLREEMRRADDLDRTWPTADLVGGLQLMKTPRKALIGHFESRGDYVISLRSLMEVAIRERNEPDAIFKDTALYAIRNIGIKGFWTTIHGISQLVEGERCRREWEHRLDYLRRVREIRGEFPYASEPSPDRL